MKRRAFTFIELILSMTLFFITLFPLLKYVHFSFITHRKYLKLEEDFINFKALEKQMQAKTSLFLRNYLGKKEYNYETFGKDSLTESIYLPYELNRNFLLELEIFEIFYQTRDEKYNYIEIKIMYINNNKSFKSNNLVGNW